ncbi:hypothetical protein QYM36_008245 [Artemia franciscana]|uniref:Uncharacterized protein n=1 Tax=Artemia franciscana TaxID=6661 RepID=A0AA88IHZ6_ARTSF|nr:hypothetical protein QYM36_008245 [Artemia franciscana]
MEKVCCKATIMMPCLRGKPYKDHLKTLELPSLSNRYKKGDAIQMFKMKAKIENLPFKKLFRKTAINQARGHSEKVHKPEARKHACVSFFSEQAVDTWNNLSEHAIQAPNINSFKNRIDKSWEKHSNKFNAFAEWPT